LICTSLLFLCGLVCSHANEKAKPKDDDLDRLQGIWRVVSLTEKGTAIAKEATDAMEIVIDKDTFTASDKSEVLVKYQFKLDATKMPKHIDFKHLIGESKGGVEPGIYRFENDKIRMVLDEDRKGRPMVFDGKETASYSVIVLERKPVKGREN
jgi:uncharacterized protein (TIGR03067 family)